LFTIFPANSDAERGIAQIVPTLAPYEFSVDAYTEDAVCQAVFSV